MPDTVMDMDFTLTELDHRSADGIEVSLLWSRNTNRLLVAVAANKASSSTMGPLFLAGHLIGRTR